MTQILDALRGRHSSATGPAEQLGGSGEAHEPAPPDLVSDSANAQVRLPEFPPDATTLVALAFNEMAVDWAYRLCPACEMPMVPMLASADWRIVSTEGGASRYFGALDELPAILCNCANGLHYGPQIEAEIRRQYAEELADRGLVLQGQPALVADGPQVELAEINQMRAQRGLGPRG